jgi:hypothetical protein
LEAGSAVAIDGHGGRFDGHAGAQGRDPRHVHALFAFRHGAADDHIVHFLFVQPGTRAIAPWMATAARSSGRVARNVPLGPSLPPFVPR